MSEIKERAYPVPSIRRLPLYLSFLRQLRSEQVEVVSSTRIAEELGLTGIQVRKDLAMTGIVGRPKIGHSINELVGHIECFLGWDEPRPAFLVGVGHLGTALLGYKGFKQENLDILASFDSSPQKIGTTILGRPTYPLSEFAQRAKKMNVKCAILTVPAPFAQEITDLMVEAGIQGIWNFAPVQLFVPEGVIVENVSLSSSLAVLSQRMANQFRREEAAQRDALNEAEAAASDLTKNSAKPAARNSAKPSVKPFTKPSTKPSTKLSSRNSAKLSDKKSTKNSSKSTSDSRK